jgi:hypothetical protein
VTEDMSERLQSKTAGFGEERVLRSSRIYFEPGNHPDNVDLLGMYNRVGSGEINLHLWNPEVATRMSEYYPEVIALDGAYPTPPFTEFDPYQKRLVWFSLPDRPKEINNAGQVYLVRGDLSYGDVVGTVMLAEGKLMTEKNTGEIEKLIGEMDNLKAEQLNQDLAESNLEILGGASLGGITGLVGASLYLSQLTGGKEAGEEQDDKRVASISRRRFCQLAAIVGGLGLGYSFLEAVGRLYVPSLGAGAANKKGEELVASVIKFFSPKLKKPIFINGLTALLIAKEEDALKYLGKDTDTPGAVIMGRGHFSGAEQFITDPILRSKTITQYVEHVVKTFNEFATNYGYPKEEIRRVLLDQIARIEIIRVQDPGDPLTSSSVENSVQLISDIRSPQIEAAISQFRI